MCCVSISAVVVGCAVLKEPEVKRFKDMSNYKYAIVGQTQHVSSSIGYGSVGNLSGYSGSVSKSVNPSEVITGILMKKGYIIVDKAENDSTFMVTYGQGDKRNVLGGLGGYTLGVTIQMLDAKSKEALFVCSAEGKGSTEADDIRIAIERCLKDF
ncbi:DUF4136 domain-containing protein [Helicobacter saguini]|uniref:DUF4136 domain-containing protein n=1 Tax=Helicobacter saguini TaxID=1548018 RepID=A0A347VU95_9HELI|nr:DUF4136 domain-containing protein [Helicobacter saguini]MWV66823.1 DUF4136 domain-containing protein [Helicobacter saguini]MWV69173.1 DUF4136 domain-containing protein [Helicobacter saguini]MWV71272.1 DUF4136 domain-containing protein [Helicobacter saguini]TLD94247.1 DUF4136 domain-containing protein [Helicobacter saguini]